MKRHIYIPIFLSLIILFTLPLCAQEVTLSGVIHGVDGKPIGNATVECLKGQADSTIVASVATGSSGIFTLNKPAELLPVRVRALGYTTYTFLAKEGSVDTITLRPVDIAIEGVRIGGRNVVLSKEGATYYPSEVMVKRSVNGFDLLDELNIARLDVNPHEMSVRVLGGGKPALFINGRPAEWNDLLALSPKMIRKVEYTDQPLAQFPDAAVVLNVVAQERTSGGIVGCVLLNGVTANYGEDRFASHFFFPQQELAIKWTPQYRNVYTQKVFSHEQYLFPSDTVTREAKPDPARLAYWNNAIVLRYKWYRARRLFSVEANALIDRLWHSDYRGVTETSQLSGLGGPSPLQRQRFDERSNSRSVLPSLTAHYEQPVGETGIFRSTGFYSLGEEFYTFARKETDEGTGAQLFDQNSSSRQRPLQAGGKLQYGWQTMLAEKFALGVSGQLEHTYTSIRATDVERDLPLPTSVRHESRGMVLATFCVGNLSLAGMLDARRSELVEPSAQVDYRLAPGAHIAYKLFKFWSLDLDYFNTNYTPTLATRNPQTFWHNPYLRVAGTPGLKDERFEQIALNSTVYFPGFRFFLQAKYSWSRDKIVPVDQLGLAGGRYFVDRRYANIPSSYRFTPNGSLRIDNMFGIVSIAISGGVQLQHNEIDKSFSIARWIPYGQGSLKFALSDWRLDLYGWYGKEDGLEGSLLSEQGFMGRAELRYLFWEGYGSFAVGVNGVLANDKTLVTRSLSPYAPSESYRSVSSLCNMVYARLALRLDWGMQDPDLPDAQLEGESTKSSIFMQNRSER